MFAPNSGSYRLGDERLYTIIDAVAEHSHASASLTNPGLYPLIQSSARPGSNIISFIRPDHRSLTKNRFERGKYQLSELRSPQLQAVASCYLWRFWRCNGRFSSRVRVAWDRMSALYLTRWKHCRVHGAADDKYG